MKMSLRVLVYYTSDDSGLDDRLKKCNRCGETLKYGDEYVSKKKSGGKRVRYHTTCARQINLL